MKAPGYAIIGVVREYENPSAGKFEPPPPPPTPGETRTRNLRPVTLVLVCALIAGRWLYPSARGWASAALTAVAAIVLILEITLSRTEADEKGPYRKQDHLTR